MSFEERILPKIKSKQHKIFPLNTQQNDNDKCDDDGQNDALQILRNANSNSTMDILKLPRVGPS